MSLATEVMLELRNVSHRYGSFEALRSLNLSVPPGVVVGLLGPNGAGKSTAMRAALGATRPKSGSVFWRGRLIEPSDRRRFGYMPEERGLYPGMRVEEQLVYFARLHGWGKSQAADAAERWLARLGLDGRAKDRLDALSLGNQQRVQLAAALIHGPELLILDEPFSGLDPDGVDECGAILREQAARGVGILFSSHQLDLVQKFCERVVILNDGTVVAEGDLRDLIEPDPTDIELEISGDDDIPLRLGAALGAGVRCKVAKDQHEGGRWALSLRLDHLSAVPDILAAAASIGTIHRFGPRTRHLSDVFRESVSAKAEPLAVLVEAST